MNRKERTKFFWPSGAGIWTPDFQQFSHPWFEFSCEVRSLRSNQNKLLKEIGLYVVSCPTKTKNLDLTLTTTFVLYENFFFLLDDFRIKKVPSNMRRWCRRDLILPLNFFLECVKLVKKWQQYDFLL
jgi:hypothetical protein